MKTIFDVFLASPDDAVEARAAAETAMEDWNREHGLAENVQFRSRYYRKDAIPILGRGDAQSVTNAQLVDTSQVVLGIFHRRLGTQTARAASGSAEEIKRALRLNKIIHLYFSEQIRGGAEFQPGLLAFRKEVEPLGLVGIYESPGSLHKQIMTALDHDVSELRLRDTSRGAWLQPVAVRASGSSSILVGFDRQSGRVEVRNAGSHVIEDLVVVVSRHADTPPPLDPADKAALRAAREAFGGRKRGFLQSFASAYFSIDKKLFRFMTYVPFEVSYEDHGEVQRYEYVLAASQNY
ncbi:hypothetical protein [Humibacillus xanthopallidus]|uniref:hypothetical protein n=1 Tax=Humibacillus xanthopallidus TaxID=412689 RepID=UPI00384FBB59